MMRIFLIIIILLFNNSNAIADLYQCNFQNGDLTIHVDPIGERRLKSGNYDSGVFEKGDKVFDTSIYVGEITFFPKKGTTIWKDKYDVVITSNSRPGDKNYFRAIFFENGTPMRPHTVVIKMWEKNLPAYLYNSNDPDKVDKGNCK